MEKILLLGAGEHCKVVIDAIEAQNKYEIAGIIDLSAKVGSFVNGYLISGIDDQLERYFLEDKIKNCIVTAGTIGDCSLRVKLFEKAKIIGFNFVNVIHPSAIISKSVLLGLGVFINAGVIINSDAKIGDNCIINTGSIIEHDCVIDKNVHISPGCVLSGGVTVGEKTHIGTGTIIIQHRTVGSDSLIGAGSNVVKNIASGVLAYGNPCKEISTGN